MNEARAPLNMPAPGLYTRSGCSLGENQTRPYMLPHSLPAVLGARASRDLVVNFAPEVASLESAELSTVNAMDRFSSSE